MMPTPFKSGGEQFTNLTLSSISSSVNYCDNRTLSAGKFGRLVPETHQEKIGTQYAQSLGRKLGSACWQAS